MKESEKKKTVCIMFEPKVIEALTLYSEMLHAPKSFIIATALKQYLNGKEEFRNNPKIKKILKESDFLTI